LKRRQVRELFDALTEQRQGVSLDIPVRDALCHGRD